MFLGGFGFRFIEFWLPSALKSSRGAQKVPKSAQTLVLKNEDFRFTTDLSIYDQWKYLESNSHNLDS